MAAPGSMADGVLVVMPPNSAGVIHQGQGGSSAISQTPGMVQCGPQQFTVMNQLGNQPLGSTYPRCPAEQIAQLRNVGMMEIFLKAQPKTLGAIQILIGLIHIGFGGVSTIFIKYIAVSGIVGYPFCEGIFFIISGSLSVVAENRGNICLVKSSRGMNNTSAIFSSIGIILFLTELILNTSHDHKDEEYRWLSAGKGITGMLLLLSILEFSIAVSTSYFASQAIRYTPNTAIAFRPCAANENVGVPSTPVPPPPPYTNEAYDPKEET
ncbi:unnamed protein product [Lepidochelys olivacea]